MFLLRFYKIFVYLTIHYPKNLIFFYIMVPVLINMLLSIV